jgi:predicted DCC family thiol-disulfide oxidoreductase YuxK
VRYVCLNEAGLGHIPLVSAATARAAGKGDDGRVSAPVLIFDGDCGFCSATARFIERRIPTPARVAPWQRLDLGPLGLTERECAEAVQWVGADGRRGSGPVAVGYLLGGSTWAWKPLGWLLLHPPVRWLAWPVYRWISRHRHQLPGGTPACALPLTNSDLRHEDPVGQ